jgi:outer membrane protein TolC
MTFRSRAPRVSAVLVAAALWLAPLSGGAADPNAPAPDPNSAEPDPNWPVPDPNAPGQPRPSSAIPSITRPTESLALGGELPLKLVQAERLALENNLRLLIERSRPQVAAQLVRQARGLFNPLGFAAYGFDHTEELTASAVQSAFGSPSRIEGDIWTYSGGLSGIVPLGLRYSSAYTFRRTDSNSGFFALERDNRPAVVNQVTLPLLKDLIYNEPNVAYKRSKIGKEISDEDFRRAVIDILAQVENRYWDLAARRAGVRVAQKSLRTADDLLAQVNLQYRVGVVAKVAVAQAEAGLAQRQFGLIDAENLAGDAQDQLLDAIAVPGPEQFARTTIIPEDPAYVEYSVDESAAIETALRVRPEVQIVRKQLEEAELQLAYARNQRLPRLDMNASYTLSGLSGPQKIPAGTPIPPITDSVGNQLCPGARSSFNGGAVAPDLGCGLIQPTGFPEESWDAHDDYFNADGAHGWALGGRVEIPVPNTTARARDPARDRAAPGAHRHEAGGAGHHRRGAQGGPGAAFRARGDRRGGAAPRGGGGDRARRAGAAAARGLDAARRARARGPADRGRATADRLAAAVPGRHHAARTSAGHAARDAPDRPPGTDGPLSPPATRSPPIPMRENPPRSGEV